ncbi:MAG: lipoyl(octanoyl) transferase LipB [Mariprofundaceae bacterium]|nr:lipoyl(octanoyl) transferase LipB [Mariprofundaceae bacterium]
MLLAVVRHPIQAYPDAIAEQEKIVAAVLANESGNTLILTMHPPIFTLGTSAQAADVLRQQFDGVYIKTHRTGRGGQVTYHGPGQLLCYVVADLRKQRDLHMHVQKLETMVIATLQDMKIHAERSSRGIGVWVNGNKIAAVGVRCRKWIAFHGIALNISPDLHHFSGIVACGMQDNPVTSIALEGGDSQRAHVESLLIRHAHALWGS